MAGHDHETHARLLNAAAELFAARGFKDVTVREICAHAGANVAAVNYHFGDKLGLYQEVVSKAIDTMRAATDAAREAGTRLPADEKLRAYIRVFLRRVITDGPDSWIYRMMAREIADPSPALDRIAQQVIAPRADYIASIVSEMTGRPAEDALVRRCAMSVQAQCHAAMPHPLTKRALLLPPDNTIDDLANHIAEFSLAGVQRVHGVQKAEGVREVIGVRARKR
ncbi:MAG TPA: CerR family C-terminal domain-containing protein [Vicinamibacterales bacterium]|jgi:AcrR family transcriptional regulator|nr:CerR family C-terminal domain-containing protein [Vicinamibacterales bacterium]